MARVMLVVWAMFVACQVNQQTVPFRSARQERQGQEVKPRAEVRDRALMRVPQFFIQSESEKSGFLRVPQVASRTTM